MTSKTQTWLHRVDPRLKVLTCTVLIVLAFAAGNWSRLAVSAGAVLILCVTSRCGGGWVVRTLWPFRWLLFFTCMMHLFLSPGYTLFGLSWLSRDGLFRGLMVCGQVAAAALAAALLNRTTAVEETARAFGSLMRPLRLVGCPVRSWEELVALVLRFFPIMREELRSTAGSATGRWQDRIMAWEERLLPLFDRLVERADALAKRLAAGEEIILPEQAIPTKFSLAGANLGLLAGLFLSAALYAVAG